MEGAWEVTSLEAIGRKAPPGEGPERFVVREGRATFFAKGQEMPTFRQLRLDFGASKTPKAVDLVRGEGDFLPCIYELKGDELKLATPLVPPNRKPGEPLVRPSSFDTKDKPVALMVAKRTGR
jgi:uncharacterized protein (TIGR03067 family)